MSPEKSQSFNLLTALASAAEKFTWKKSIENARRLLKARRDLMQQLPTSQTAKAIRGDGQDSYLEKFISKNGKE